MPEDTPKRERGRPRTGRHPLRSLRASPELDARKAASGKTWPELADLGLRSLGL